MALALLTFSYNLLLLMGFYTFARLFFLIYHWPEFSSLAMGDLFFAFVHGLRFDFSTILLINSPLLIFVLVLSLRKKWLVHLPWMRGPFVFINSLFLIPVIGDAEYINFTGRRLTKDVLFMSGELSQQALQLLQYYWFFTLLLIVLIALLFYLTHFQLPKIKLSKFHSLAFIFIFFLSVFVGARGGWQLKPLQPNHAFAHSSAAVGKLTLNSNFTFLKSKMRAPHIKKNYFESDEKALEFIHSFRNSENLEKSTRSKINLITLNENKNRTQKQNENKLSSTPSLKGQNVVIILLESFALEYVKGVKGQKSYTPFLNELAKRSLYFENAFANGRRSIEAIPSILCATPSLLSQPLITSDFQSNQFTGLGNIFLEQAYSTHFFHGGENGTMFFDSFSRRIGFENYYGYNEYPNKERDFDGNWGIYDEPFFEYSIQKLNEVKKPFLSVIFTLSSHQPYSIPPDLRKQFPRGNLEIHESIGYTDYALKSFFEKVKDTDWYNNTLFVITADHTQKSEGGEYADDLGAYRIPILFFHPQIQWLEVPPQKVVQHADIAPTILDLFEIPEQKLPSLGYSIFKSQQGVAINFTGTENWLLTDKYFIKWNEDNFPRFFTHQNTKNLSLIENPESINSAVESLTPYSELMQNLEYFKATLQVFNNGLIDNNLF